MRTSAVRFGAVAVVVTALAACSGTPSAPAPATVPRQTTLVAHVTGSNPGPFGANLEGASFDAAGRFSFVDSTAPPGRPKILAFDPVTNATTPLYTDDRSVINCLVHGPDGATYVCDMTGRIARFDPAARTLTTVLGPVDGRPIVPDDLAFTPDGTMYVTDYTGDPSAPTGRVVARAPDGTARTVVGGLVRPNGITAGADGLWITESLLNRLDHLAVEPASPADPRVVPTLTVAARVDLGARALTDSVTTDGAGNVYVAAYRAGAILVFDPDGAPLGRIALPASAPRPTHVAIRPGTTTAYVTASGPDGGSLHTFPALAPAAADRPSGG